MSLQPFGAVPKSELLSEKPSEQEIGKGRRHNGRKPAAVRENPQGMSPQSVHAELGNVAGTAVNSENVQGPAAKSSPNPAG